MNTWNCARESFFRNTTEPSAAAPCNWSTYLAKSTPIAVTFSMNTSPIYWSNLNSLPKSKTMGMDIHTISVPFFGVVQVQIGHVVTKNW